MSDNDGIACIGWGSLIWRDDLPAERMLPLRGGWHDDGPLLPVEFARQSETNELTLVICPGLPDVPRVQTLWAVLDVVDVAATLDRLGVREFRNAQKVTGWMDRYVGHWSLDGNRSSGMEAETVGSWARAAGLAGAVWTNLPCKFAGRNGVMPTSGEVLAHLRALKGDELARAETYVRRAPAQIDTPYRRRIAQELGWEPRPATTERKQ